MTTKTELNKSQYQQLVNFFAKHAPSVDTSSIEVLNNLESLDLEGSTLREIAVVTYLTGLTALSLRNSSVVSLFHIAELTNLKVLNLSGTSIVDVSPLADIPQLEHLDLSDTQVIDILPLAKITYLVMLLLSSDTLVDKATKVAKTIGISIPVPTSKSLLLESGIANGEFPPHSNK